MALKSLLLFSVLVAVIAVPVAQVQLLGCSGGGLGDLLGGLGGLLGNLVPNLLCVIGTIYCTPNGNIGIKGTATPVFPNALLQLQCGGNVVSTVTTNGSGIFSIPLDPLSIALPTLVNGCKLAVNTPLAFCNANLPSVGGLVSKLQFMGNTMSGPVNIGNLVPANFQFIANMN